MQSRYSFAPTLARRAALVTAVALAAACRSTDSPAATDVVDVDASLHATERGEVNATVTWNRAARDLVKKYATGAAPAMRVYALVSLVQHEAATEALHARGGRMRASDAAAVAGASAAMLTYLYPAEAAALEAKVDSQEAAAKGWRGRPGDFARGEQLGREVAALEIARAKVDGFFTPFTGTVPTCDGCWRAVPTPPAFATLGAARTFFLDSGSQFRPVPPPAWGSPAFVAAIAEVRQFSDLRTPEQDSIAKFWALQGGTVTPLGHWNIVADGLIVRRGMSERAAARVFALVNMAGYDALVASHEAKYTYWTIRPTQADPGITLAVGLPSFPSYPSNHAAISAAAARVLGAIFPRHRSELAAAAEEAGISRIYGGIHYRFDSDAGITLGKQVADLVLDRTRRGKGPLN